MNTQEENFSYTRYKAFIDVTIHIIVNAVVTV